VKDLSPCKGIGQFGVRPLTMHQLNICSGRRIVCDFLSLPVSRSCNRCR
jgi:hypothetical protein